MAGSFPRSGRRASRSAPRKLALTKQQFVSMLNARREKKYFTGNDETSLAVNGVINPLTQEIIVADTGDARDGSQINVCKLDLSLQLLMNGSAVADIVRFIVFADMQANGVYPAVTDLLTSGDPNAPYTRTVTVQHRYKILHDSVITLSTGGSNRVVVHRKALHLGNHPVYYAGTTSVETANGKGALYYFLCSDEATNVGAFNLDWAVSYYDS